MAGRDEQILQYNNKTNKILNKCPDYVRDFSFSFTNKSALTRYNYIAAVKRFLDFIAYDYHIDIYDASNLNILNKNHINNYIYNKLNGKSESYIAMQIYAIKFFFGFLEDGNYISSDPSSTVKAPANHKMYEVVSLSPEEINKVIKNIKKGEVQYEYIGTHKRRIALEGEAAEENDFKIRRNLVFFLMGITTGLRCSEMRNIDIDDINLKNCTIKIVEKGGYERHVYISNELAKYIRTYLRHRARFLGNQDCNALFINSKKKRCSYNEIYKVIEDATKCIDKHISPHKLRSTYATNLYNQTGDIYLVAQGLNHKNIKNTMRYAKPSEEKNKAAAELMGNLFITKK